MPGANENQIFYWTKTFGESVLKPNIPGVFFQ